MLKQLVLLGSFLCSRFCSSASKGSREDTCMQKRMSDDYLKKPDSGTPCRVTPRVGATGIVWETGRKRHLLSTLVQRMYGLSHIPIAIKT